MNIFTIKNLKLFEEVRGIPQVNSYPLVYNLDCTRFFGIEAVIGLGEISLAKLIYINKSKTYNL